MLGSFLRATGRGELNTTLAGYFYVTGAQENKAGATKVGPTSVLKE